MSDLRPDGFPRGIKVHRRDYRNWSQTIEADGVWVCEPASANDVVTVCNWAMQSGWTVRAQGIRHGWSPLTITAKPGSKVLLVDTTVGLTGITFIPRSGSAPPMVKVGTGVTMEQLLTTLEQQQGGQGPASGYAFPHTPAPGHLTVGGVLAINGHGTAIPSQGDAFAASYGSLSNQIMAFTAVVTDPALPNQYTLRTFQRGDADAPAFLSHAGRAFLVDATLQLVDNYNLRCQSFTNISANTLFAAPTSGAPAPANSMASFLETSGRVEAIWYPFTTAPWVKVWTVTPQQPAGSKLVTGPYNYPFSDNVPTIVTTLIKIVTSVAPSRTPELGQLFAKITSDSLANGLSDLWGASKNTLLYIKDTTLRVTANGYAVQMRRADVQQAVHDFTTQFSSMLASYQAKGSYPVNSPLEIRVTALDDPANVYAPPGTTARSPIVSSLAYDDVAKQNGWDVALWLDVLTLPGTSGSNQFYTELENWFQNRFTGSAGRVYPEWSKGWAYTADKGPWTSAAFEAGIRNAYTEGRGANDTWNQQVATLKKYDDGGLFTNPFLDQMFVSV